MYAVIFEVIPHGEGKAEYLEIAGMIRSFLENRKGFISIERFQSLVHERKLLSLSFWEDEQSIDEWRNLFEHRHAQTQGRSRLFESYRIRVAQVVRDYTDTDRTDTPVDSK